MKDQHSVIMIMLSDFWQQKNMNMSLRKVKDNEKREGGDDDDDNGWHE